MLTSAGADGGTALHEGSISSDANLVAVDADGKLEGNDRLFVSDGLIEFGVYTQNTWIDQFRLVAKPGSKVVLRSLTANGAEVPVHVFKGGGFVPVGPGTIDLNTLSMEPCRMPDARPMRSVGEPRFWVWKDCRQPGPSWTILSSAGKEGSTAIHEGTITSSTGLVVSDPDGKVDGNDTLSVSESMVEFLLQTQNTWIDEFTISATPRATVVLEQLTVDGGPADAYIFVDGQFINAGSAPFDLTTYYYLGSQ